MNKNWHLTIFLEDLIGDLDKTFWDNNLPDWVMKQNGGINANWYIHNETEGREMVAKAKAAGVQMVGYHIEEIPF